MVEVFRTNIDNEYEVDYILRKLQEKFSGYKINFDLEDCDNILRMETKDTKIDETSIIGLVKSYGFKIEVLADEIPKRTKSNLFNALKFSTCFGFIFGILVLGACGSAKHADCINESKISDGPCTMEYNPVCGCDGKTYGNACQAERSGVTSWEQSECENKNQ